MSEETMRMLMVAAKLKLQEANIPASEERFTLFWNRFAYNLSVAWQNETAKAHYKKAKAQLIVEERAAEVVHKKKNSVMVVALSFAVGWIFGWINGFFSF